jgi:hypothetical protein
MMKPTSPLSVCLSMGLQLFQFLDLFTQSVGLLGRGISPSQGRYLHTGQHKQNKRTQTFMPQVEFEPTIPLFEWVKTVHALDHVAAVICNFAPSWDQMQGPSFRALS